MWFALPLLVLSVAGSAGMVLASVLLGRFARAPLPPAAAAEPITVLKPLHGAEPRLADNLATLLDQDWSAPIQLVAGVQRADDPAIPIARALGPDVELVVDPTPHGANAKIANLINMAPAARAKLIVLADSDMAVSREYLATLVRLLAMPGTGAVTCAYRGRGDAGGWSVLAAAGISYHFLPQLVTGLALGLARPGMGSTIALRAETLAAIGGFARVADSLADDYELCEAVRALGLAVRVPPMLLVHGCAERSLGEVWRHELRWAATILRINPGGQIGTIVTHPVPLALLALPFAPGLAGIALALGLATRWLVQRRVDRLAGASSAPAWLLPLRDCLSLAVFVGAFGARRVEWRGRRLTMARRGRIVPEREFPTI